MLRTDVEVHELPVITKINESDASKTLETPSSLRFDDLVNFLADNWTMDVLKEFVSDYYIPEDDIVDDEEMEHYNFDELR